MRTNPGRLKLELLCSGIKIDTDIAIGEETRRILRTRGGLGSGLDIILPEGVWVNAPVYEHFVRETPYLLIKDDKDFWILRNNEKTARVRLPKNPEFYQKKTSDGIEMTRIGVMQGGYLAFYLGPRCGFWDSGLNCRFCSSGLNIGKSEIPEKNVNQVVEVAREAFSEGAADFIHINTGFVPDESRGLMTIEPYVRALKRETGSLIAVQTNPPKTNEWIEKAYSFGVDSMSFDFEIFDRETFKKICPGKASLIGQKRFFESMEHAVKVFPNGSVAGELIAGLEPVESTLKAVEYITSAGALPVVCVFRPLENTPLQNLPPPKPEEIEFIFSHTYSSCRKNNIRMYLADKVSIVVMPIEGRYFSCDKPNLRDFIMQNIFRTKLGKKAFAETGNIRRRRR